MTLRNIEVFVSVYQEMNITRAAERLNMTQPAVTRAVKEIESYYGVRLFERINQRIYATECCKAFYEHAVHIIDSVDSLEKEFRSWDQYGILRVGASITLGNYVLPRLVSDFRKTHPDFNIQVTISNGGKIQHLLLANDIDLALIEGSVPAENFHAERLLTDRLVLIVPPGHPLLRAESVKVEDLGHYPLLLREEGSAGRTYVDQVFGIHGLQVEPMWTSASTQALVKAVMGGLGISILPEHLVRYDLDMGHVVAKKVDDEAFMRENFIVWHNKKYLTRTAKEFVKACHTMKTDY